MLSAFHEAPSRKLRDSSLVAPTILFDRDNLAVSVDPVSRFGSVGTLRARPIDRLEEERQVMRPLPEREVDLDRRWVVRVPPDPHLRFDTNDYSLDPNLVGRRRGSRQPAGDHGGRAGQR